MTVLAIHFTGRADCIELIKQSSSALDVLCDLTRLAMDSGEGMEAWGEGYMRLVLPHLTAIEEATVWLSDELKSADPRERKASDAAGLRRNLIAEAVRTGVGPDKIAEAMNMQRGAVESVIRKLRGEEPDTEAKAVNG